MDNMIDFQILESMTDRQILELIRNDIQKVQNDMKRVQKNLDDALACTKKIAGLGNEMSRSEFEIASLETKAVELSIVNGLNDCVFSCDELNQSIRVDACEVINDGDTSPYLDETETHDTLEEVRGCSCFQVFDPGILSTKDGVSCQNTIGQEAGKGVMGEYFWLRGHTDHEGADFHVPMLKLHEYVMPTAEDDDYADATPATIKMGDGLSLSINAYGVDGISPLKKKYMENTWSCLQHGEYVISPTSNSALCYLIDEEALAEQTKNLHNKTAHDFDIAVDKALKLDKVTSKIVQTSASFAKLFEFDGALLAELEVLLHFLDPAPSNYKLHISLFCGNYILRRKIVRDYDGFNGPGSFQGLLNFGFELVRDYDGFNGPGHTLRTRCL